MDTRIVVFIIYSIIGFLLVIFNKFISELFYNLTLYFTEKINLKEVFLFKVDNTNRNSMFFLTRSFTIAFGIMIIASSIYYISIFK